MRSCPSALCVRTGKGASCCSLGRELPSVRRRLFRCSASWLSGSPNLWVRAPLGPTAARRRRSSTRSVVVVAMLARSCTGSFRNLRGRIPPTRQLRPWRHLVGSVRVVTTNYDRHLSACLPEETDVYESPGLPGSVDFTGVVHIHGSIGQCPDRLVITMTDFAEVYMQPHSPTLGFLQQLFVSQVVLFIGYSLQDTLIQYILRAVGSGAELYTLTDEPESPRWVPLGVEAVDCGSLENIPAMLTEWAQVAGASFEEHDQRARRILASQPGDGGPSPQDESYLAHIISDPDLVRIFTERARGPAWLRWVSTRPDSKLFAPMSELGPVDRALVLWFVRHHNDDDATAAEAIRLIIENQGRLHETLRVNMIMALNPRGGASAETANRLLLVLADTVVPGFELHLLHLIRCCETPRDDNLLVELVDRMCRPKLREPAPFWAAAGLPGLFRAECQDPSGDVSGREPDREFWSQWRHLAPDLLSIADGHLRSVQRIEAIAGNPYPYDGSPGHRTAPTEHRYTQRGLPRRRRARPLGNPLRRPTRRGDRLPRRSRPLSVV